MTYLHAFLTSPDLRRKWRAWAHLPPSDDALLDKWATRLAAEPTLLARLAEREANLFGTTDDTRYGMEASETDDRTMDGLYALLGLLAVPRIEAAHQARGIDATVSRGVCFDIGIAVERYRHVHGNTVWGAERWLLGWWRLIASGELYRIGRLEYHPCAYQGVAIAFRHRESGAIVALSADGILYDRDGYAVTDAANPPPGTWEATFYEDEDGVTGYVLPPTGLASRQQVGLTRAEWEPVLQPGDFLLDVHIPAGSPLDADASRQSLMDALTFFERYAPPHPVRGFMCHSWLLDPAWQARLQTGRLVGWARQPYLFPVASGDNDGLYFVFARHDITPAQTRATTRLEILMRDAVANGEPLRSGGMFLLSEDAPLWGQEPYRRAWPAVEALLASSTVR